MDVVITFFIKWFVLLNSWGLKTAIMSSQVQGTNDSSIVSKHSIVQQGYFKDPYIHHFVNKRSRRSPLINLGYYVRAVVIEKVLLQFFKSVQCRLLFWKDCQILSLGAGFDTSFFRISDLPNSNNITYFEIDLPDVVRRKASIITSCDELRSKLQNLDVGFSDCGLWSKYYRLLAGDLRDLSAIKNVLENYKFDPRKPTLVLSECSITYMDEMSSRKLIEFTSSFLRDAVFVTYEQICPDDGFGIVMTDHFETINSPLLSVTSYPLLEDQEKRFVNCGWKQCRAMTVWEAFVNLTGEEERRRALSLEPFDEWEEWQLKCNHYGLVVAGKGWLLSWEPFPNFGDFNPPDCFPSYEVLPVHVHLVPEIKLFGHCSFLFLHHDKNYILNIGGFGQLNNGSHRRLKNLSYYELTNHTFHEIESGSAGDFDFMYHSCTVLSNSVFGDDCSILYGGRKSPLECVNSVPKLVKCKFNNNILSVETSDLIQHGTSFPHDDLFDEKPEPRWRHSACVMGQYSTQIFLVFGGCSQNLKVFDDFWLMHLKGMPGQQCWKKINSWQDPEGSPCGRFSHSVSVHGNVMYLSGGMNDKLEALSDIWSWNYENELWWELPIRGILPRYGHTSHIFTNRSGVGMALIGGVATQRETRPTIAIINVLAATGLEYDLPGMEPMKSIMLHNHSSVIDESKGSVYIIGGGGNCFSFGTKFNNCIIELTGFG